MIEKMISTLTLGTAWGSSVIIMKFAALSGIDIAQIIFFATLGVVITLFSIMRLRNIRFVLRRRFMLFGLLCAITAYLIPESLSISVLKHIDAGLLSIVLTTVPIITYVIAVMVGEDRFNRRKLLGLLTALVAVIYLILSRNQFNGFEVSLWLLLAFATAISYAIYDVYASRAWPDGYDSLEVAYGESLFVVVLVLPVVALNLDFSAMWDIGISAYWVILALALVWSLERVVYFIAIRRGGAVNAAQASYLAPPVSIVLGILLFDEAFDINLWFCLAVILASMTLVSSVSRTPATPTRLPDRDLLASN